MPLDDSIAFIRDVADAIAEYGGPVDVNLRLPEALEFARECTRRELAIAIANCLAEADSLGPRHGFSHREFLRQCKVPTI